MPSWLLRYFRSVRVEAEWILSFSNVGLGLEQSGPCSVFALLFYLLLKCLISSMSLVVLLLEQFWVLLSFPPLLFLVHNLLSLFQCATVGFQVLMIVKIFAVDLFRLSSMAEDVILII